MKTDIIKLSDKPNEDIQNWIDNNPETEIKFILGNVDGGRILIIIYQPTKPI